MLQPEERRTPPITLATDNDLETMLCVTDYMTPPVMYVTSGPELVAKYQFLCRSPFKVGERNFLEEGVTEEQHEQAIKGKFLIIILIVPPSETCSYKEKKLLINFQHLFALQISLEGIP